MPLHDWTKVPPNVFHDFHSAWLSEIRGALNRGILPEDHFAALEQTAGEAVPDILTLRTSSDGPPSPGTTSSEMSSSDISSSGFSPTAPDGAVAVAEKPPQVEITTDAKPFLLRQKRIVIRHTLGDVVALIELVSPDNKRSFKSLDRFRTKVVSAIDQHQHVLIIDVLPPKTHDPRGMHAMIWDELSDNEYEPPANRPLTLASYEADDTTRAYVQPVSVGDAMPSMPVFLSPGWYVEVPLEATYQEAWDGAPKPWRAMLSE